MTEQWEMCTFSIHDNIYFYTPKECKIISKKEFIKGHQVQVFGNNDVDKAICMLLSDGWQPYANVLNNTSYFRRKYQG